jgi:SpoVK/Ycf46/Vps4 family AAA+-type ATPase
MPRADLLLALVRAGSRSDAATFRRSLEAIIAEERGKQHHVLADRLAEYLNGTAKDSARLSPNAPANGLDRLILELSPQRRLDDLILRTATRQEIDEVIEEQSRQSLLRAHGLEPRHKLLLVGPPGNGKTSVAEAVAEALALPFLVVRYEGVIGSFLGETASRLRSVFDYVRTRECVLFLDEFDTLGKERGDPHDTGEVKRVVSSLLLQIDALPSYVIVVTATNHPELLDRAVWRRFDTQLELPAPGPSELSRWMDQFETLLGQSLETALKNSLAKLLVGRSFSDLELFALDVLRRRVLCDPGTDLNRLVKERIAHFVQRAAAPRPSNDG